MKMKRMAKLLTLLLLVATVATGVVFAIAADDPAEEAPEFVYIPTPNTEGNYTYVSDALVFSGNTTKGSKDWQTAYVGQPSQAPGIDLTNQGKSAGDKLNSWWFSMDTLYDENVRMQGILYFRAASGSSKSEFIKISADNKVSSSALDSRGASTELFDFNGKPYGWYHIDISITASGYTIEGETVSYGDYTVNLYVNGTNEATFTILGTRLGDAFRPFTVAKDGTVSTGTGRFYFYSSKHLLNSTEKEFLWFKNGIGGVGYMDPTKMVGLTYDLGEGGEMPVWTFDAGTFSQQYDFPCPKQTQTKSNNIPGPAAGPYVDFHNIGNSTRYTYTPHSFVYDIHKYTYTYAAIGGTVTIPTPTSTLGLFTGWTVKGNPATATVAEADGVWTLTVAAEHTGAIELVAEFGTSFKADFIVDGVPSADSMAEAGTILMPDSADYWIADNGEILAAGDVVTLSKDSSFVALTVDMLEGAAVRFGNPTGLRFETTVSKAMLDVIAAIDGATWKVGTLIVPTDKLGTNAFTAAALDAAQIEYVNLSTQLTGAAFADGKYTFYASLTNILAANYTRKFSAVSYIQVTVGENTYVAYGEYVEAENARSVYDVAYTAIQSDTAYTADETVILKSYVDKVIVLDATHEGVTVANNIADKYTSPYAVTYADGTLTISRTDSVAITAENLTTIVINGEVYTAGWQFAEGKVSVAYTLPAPPVVEPPAGGGEEGGENPPAAE